MTAQGLDMFVRSDMEGQAKDVGPHANKRKLLQGKIEVSI